MDRLYKFIEDPQHVEFFLQGKLKFTPIPELNDPAELVPQVIPKQVQDSLRRIREQGYSDEDFSNHRHQERLVRRLAPSIHELYFGQTIGSKEDATKLVRSMYFDSFYPLLVQLLEELAREIASKVGLLCLSKRNNALPMWAHYAKNATGLAIEFRNLHDAFPGDETATLGEIRPVQYEDERSGVTFDPKSHELLFFSKFTDWQYEQEVRVAMALADCREIQGPKRKLYLFSIPPEHISRIILGWKMNSDAAEKVVETAKAYNSSIEIITARIEGGRVHI